MTLERFDVLKRLPEKPRSETEVVWVTKELLKQAVKEFKEKPHTPEVVTSYWKVLWKLWEQKGAFAVTVPPCDRTAEEIIHLEREGRKLVYVPDELARQENRYLLVSILPEMHSYFAKKENPVTSKSNQGGWLDIEASLDNPNLKTKEKDLENRFREQGKNGQRLSVYIIGSQDAKIQTGHYFDERTEPRIIAFLGGPAVEEHFVFYVIPNIFQYLRVLYLLGRRAPWIGRSEGAKKA